MNKFIAEVESARVYDVTRKTPLELAPKLTRQLGSNVYLKREDLQSVKSFKLLGAYNKIASLTPADRKKGVIAASAGNHAQGVALSAQKLGISALIVMPKTTPQIKVDAVGGYGSEVVLAGDNYSEAYDHCLKLIEKTGRVFVHPFDDPMVIAGQATIGQEVLEQLPEATHIFMAVGGGGLIGGIAQYVKSLRPDIKIIGVEPVDSNAMGQSLKAGKRITLPHVGTFADGVAVKQVGELTFKLAQKYVDEIIVVDIDQICAAIKSVFEDTRMVLEPAGALGVAGAVKFAARRHLPSRKPKNLVAICTGANMSFEKLQLIAERTLTGSGREAFFAITLPEKAGALHTFCNKVVNGYAITEFNYRLHRRDQAHIFVGIMVDGEEKKKLMKNMKKKGYTYTDLSHDELSKDHIKRMIGGAGDNAINERLYSVSFSERPQALGHFLVTLGDKWNISLFNYRGLGADVGKVFIGFEAENVRELEKQLKKTGFEFERAKSPAVKLFL